MTHAESGLYQIKERRHAIAQVSTYLEDMEKLRRRIFELYHKTKSEELRTLINEFRMVQEYFAYKEEAETP